MARVGTKRFALLIDDDSGGDGQRVEALVDAAASCGCSWSRVFNMDFVTYIIVRQRSPFLP